MVQIKRPKATDAVVSMQIRAGRAMLGWTQDELAERSGVSKRAIADAESAVRFQRNDTLERISAVFAEAGIEWVASGNRYGLVRTCPGADGESGLTPSLRLAT